MSRYAAPLCEHHDESHLTKFELLLEASLDLEAVPQEYLISAAYDSRLQVGGPCWGSTGQYSTGLGLHEERAYKERPSLVKWLGRGDSLRSRTPQEMCVLCCMDVALSVCLDTHTHTDTACQLYRPTHLSHAHTLPLYPPPLSPVASSAPPFRPCVMRRS